MEHLLLAKDGDVESDGAQPFQLVEFPVPRYLHGGKRISLFVGLGMLFAWACAFWV